MRVCACKSSTHSLRCRMFLVQCPLLNRRTCTCNIFESFAEAKGSERFSCHHHQHHHPRWLNHRPNQTRLPPTPAHQRSHRQKECREVCSTKRGEKPTDGEKKQRRSTATAMRLLCLQSATGTTNLDHTQLCPANNPSLEGSATSCQPLLMKVEGEATPFRRQCDDFYGLNSTSFCCIEHDLTNKRADKVVELIILRQSVKKAANAIFMPAQKQNPVRWRRAYLEEGEKSSNFNKLPIFEIPFSEFPSSITSAQRKI